MSFLDLSPEQIEVLLTFAEHNPHLAFGRVTLNSELHCEYEFKWREVTRDLNRLDMRNSRGVREYRAYWNKIKNRAQAKLNRARRHLNMAQKPTKVSLTDYELRIFNMMPKNSKDKFLVIEGIKDKNSSTSSISVKEEPISYSEVDINNRIETFLNGLEAIAASIQNVARIQVELTKGQLEMVKSLNNMAEMFKNIKQDYNKLYHEN